MSFYNFYPNRKDHRKQYYDTRRFDGSCKNHKSCPICKENRTFNLIKHEYQFRELQYY